MKLMRMTNFSLHAGYCTMAQTGVLPCLVLLPTAKVEVSTSPLTGTGGGCRTQNA